MAFFGRIWSQLAKKNTFQSFQKSSQSGKRSYSVDASLSDEEIIKKGAMQAESLWRLIPGGFVLLGVAWVYQMLKMEHTQPVVEYPYNSIRLKPYPWGDGQHSLFGGVHPGQFHHPELAKEGEEGHGHH